VFTPRILNNSMFNRSYLCRSSWLPACIDWNSYYLVMRGTWKWLRTPLTPSAYVSQVVMMKMQHRSLLICGKAPAPFRAKAGGLLEAINYPCRLQVDV